jgi:hypothetical protein
MGIVNGGHGMKKRTIITTEKREVWVIRRPAEKTPARKTKEHEIDDEDGSSVDSLIALLDKDVETDEFPDEGN